jgi:ribosomal protein S12 methylthiotransferase accessory factor
VGALTVHVQDLARRTAPAPVAPPAPRPDDPITGIVPFVAETVIERGDPSVFVAAARIADLTAYGMSSSASDGSGAGLSAAAARGAAIGEAVERYACAIVHPEDLVFGSCAELRRRGLPVVGPERWAVYHPSQAAGLEFPIFDEHTPIAWARADSLTRRTECLVPASMVYLPYEEPWCDRGERVVAPSISTGAACAAARRDALLKGICELIERDAFMIVWHNRLARPRVRIDAHSALYQIFTERFARPGLEYRIYDCTLDLGVPSFFGVLRVGLREPAGFSVGGAAHPDPNVAVLKTLLELVQGLKWMDHLGPAAAIAPAPSFAHIHTFEQRARLYGFSAEMGHALAFLDGAGEVALSALGPPPAGSVDDVLDALVPQLDAAGLEVLGVDLTSADVAACGLSVVRALLPGCEMMEGDHRTPFLGGTRWRDVPVRLGLRATPLDLDDRNPDPHPYP